VRSGKDVTILCYSRMRYVVMQAVAELEKHGYDPEARCRNIPGSGITSREQNSITHGQHLCTNAESVTARYCTYSLSAP